MIKSEGHTACQNCITASTPGVVWESGLVCEERSAARFLGLSLRRRGRFLYIQDVYVEHASFSVFVFDIRCCFSCCFGAAFGAAFAAAFAASFAVCGPRIKGCGQGQGEGVACAPIKHTTTRRLAGFRPPLCPPPAVLSLTFSPLRVVGRNCFVTPGWHLKQTRVRGHDRTMTMSIPSSLSLYRHPSALVLFFFFLAFCWH